ncbi:hypothetical protein BDV96DRAFT_649967 [Lophiotrema nucula]|uniref:DUF7730 domain-containing protein n=1 Tax=Lophiotrema nucula TaxID=690887 RepID=A0A6A5YXS7_9PLEO|nr:hypothetical protein BDV96DRAFT_649967 [Lophiotrema nucula]
MAKTAKKTNTAKRRRIDDSDDEYVPPISAKKSKKDQMVKRDSTRPKRGQGIGTSRPAYDPADLDANGAHKQQQSPFFAKLPSEIRLTIYRELMSGPYTTIKWGPHRFPDIIAAVYEAEDDDFWADNVDEEGHLQWRNALDPSCLRLCKRMWNEWREEFYNTQTFSYVLNFASLFDDHDGVEAETLFLESLEGTKDFVWPDLRVLLHHLPPRDAEENGKDGKRFHFRYQLKFDEEVYFSALERSLQGNTTIQRLVIRLDVRVVEEEFFRRWEDHYYVSVDADVGFRKLDGVLKSLQGLRVLEICSPDFDGINTDDNRLGDTASMRFKEGFKTLATRVLGPCDVSEEDCDIFGRNWSYSHEGYRCIFKKRD